MHNTETKTQERERERERQSTKRGSKEIQIHFLVVTLLLPVQRKPDDDVFFWEHVQINDIDFLYSSASCGLLYHNKITPF